MRARAWPAAWSAPAWPTSCAIDGISCSRGPTDGSTTFCRPRTWSERAARRASGERDVVAHAVTREGRTIVTTEIQVERGEARPTGRLTGRREPEPAALRTLATVEREHGRPVCVVAPSVEGLIYRGPLLGYAKDRDGHRYAVLDTGRELSAFG